MKLPINNFKIQKAEIEITTKSYNTNTIFIVYYKPVKLVESKKNYF